MIRSVMAATLAAAAIAAPLSAAVAQSEAARPVSGTRLDVVATGEVTRVPDIARINAGVVTQAQTAQEAIRQNGARMASVRAALERAGIAARDIQTSNVSLQPDYRYAENQPPQLVGYRASNEVTVRFRDIAETGRILDALVAEGANQINGPMLSVDRPEAALDEARTAAIATARARADLYARTLGMRVVRVLSVSEPGAIQMPPVPVMRMEAQARDAAGTQIEPGEQTLSVTLTVSFELQ
ncbi:SIMPL domain-containing protein [Sphingosinicella sp. LHD-64]|uniref:SIMPL domain-containing protein n=1 Tax=Sphingosinicella sp. LHD-64 TaxID=3072139 RepID=UPI00280E61EE|nr:SIMPL domain-containing protein [Sphingosinicella sp. LHD-64]MDQ8756047.1 SIMPL domain-containing protein [Sphingosinicella sp. LHD-64]